MSFHPHHKWTSQVPTPFQTQGNGSVGIGSGAGLEARSAGCLTKRVCHSFKERRDSYSCNTRREAKQQEEEGNTHRNCGERENTALETGRVGQLPGVPVGSSSYWFQACRVRCPKFPETPLEPRARPSHFSLFELHCFSVICKEP